MAVVTYTSTTYNNSPKFEQVGNQTVSGNFTWPAAGTLSDHVFLAKIPNGAKIVDFYEYHTNGQTAAVLDFGFDRGIAAGGGGNTSILISGGALATMNRFSLATCSTALPPTISLSDLDPIRYANLQAKAVSGTFTITVVIGWALTYRFDGPDPQ